VHPTIAHRADRGDRAESAGGTEGVTDGTLRCGDTRARTFAENRPDRFELRLVALGR
jgi:hypothetical protein